MQVAAQQKARPAVASIRAVAQTNRAADKERYSYDYEAIDPDSVPMPQNLNRKEQR